MNRCNISGSVQQPYLSREAVKRLKIYRLGSLEGPRAMALSLNVALLSGRSVNLSASADSTVDQLRLQAQMSLTLGRKEAFWASNAFKSAV